MTTGRVTTALGALALSFATAGAIPALAQNAPTGTSQPSATTSAPPAAAPTSNQPSAATMPAKEAMPAKHAAMPAHHPKTHVATRMAHHPTHMRMSEANPNAQNAAVDKLNQESLQAAQQGKAFMPSGAKM